MDAKAAGGVCYLTSYNICLCKSAHAPQRNHHEGHACDSRRPDSRSRFSLQLNKHYRPLSGGYAEHGGGAWTAGFWKLDTCTPVDRAAIGSVANGRMCIQRLHKITGQRLCNHTFNSTEFVALRTADVTLAADPIQHRLRLQFNPSFFPRPRQL